MKSKTVLVSILFIFISIKSASANFFKNITDLIDNNYESLRYGISVADVNNDGTYAVSYTHLTLPTILRV